MNVFVHEIKQYRKALIGWCIGFVVFVLFYMPYMPVFLDEAESLKAFIEGMGSVATAAFGIDVDTFFGPLGYYAYLFTFAYLLGAIQATALGLSVISRETSTKTVDFLLTKPRSRTAFFFQKIAAAFLCLIITQIVFYISSTATFWAFVPEGVDIVPFALISVSFTLVQFLFLALGVCIATVFDRIKSTTTIAVGISLGFFLVGMIVSLTGSDALRWFAPMRYFDTNHILVHHAYEAEYLVLCCVLIVVFLAIAYVVYRKKDIDAV